MEPSLSLTLEQLDTINRSLNKSMAVAQVLANCGPERRPVPESPEAVDVFLVMQMVLEELEKIREITRVLGDKPPK